MLQKAGMHKAKDYIMCWARKGPSEPGQALLQEHRAGGAGPAHSELTSSSPGDRAAPAVVRATVDALRLCLAIKFCSEPQ